MLRKEGLHPHVVSVNRMHEHCAEGLIRGFTLGTSTDWSGSHCWFSLCEESGPHKETRSVDDDVATRHVDPHQILCHAPAHEAGKHSKQELQKVTKRGYLLWFSPSRLHDEPEKSEALALVAPFLYAFGGGS